MSQEQNKHNPKYNLGTEVFLDEKGRKVTVSNIGRDLRGKDYLYSFHGTSVKRTEKDLIRIQETQQEPETFNFEHQKDALMMMAGQMEDAAIALSTAVQNLSNLQKEFEKMSNEIVTLTQLQG